MPLAEGVRGGRTSRTPGRRRGPAVTIVKHRRTRGPSGDDETAGPVATGPVGAVTARSGQDGSGSGVDTGGPGRSQHAARSAPRTVSAPRVDTGGPGPGDRRDAAPVPSGPGRSGAGPVEYGALTRPRRRGTAQGPHPFGRRGRRPNLPGAVPRGTAADGPPCRRWPTGRHAAGGRRPPSSPPARHRGAEGRPWPQAPRGRGGCHGISESAMNSLTWARTWARSVPGMPTATWTLKPSRRARSRAA